MVNKTFKFYISILFAVGLLASCQSKEPTSIFVIAVDDLPVTEIQCNEELLQKNHSGLGELCKNSVRFTHFFTSSPLTLPALSSLLTGQYPFAHKVHGSADHLDAEFSTSAELALQKNYRTSFFSGGPSVLKKSNVHQGFEVFDDHLVISKEKVHRPFQKNIDLFLEWLTDEVGSQPFFSMIYVPDLGLAKNDITTDLGEVRATDLSPALDDFDEKLYALIEQLKKQKRWDSTYFILVGLNGKAYNDRADEFAKINLHSENTQTALFIKNPSKPRDEGLAWKTDTNYSMADLGFTIFNLIDSNYKAPEATQSTPFKVYNFRNYLSTQTVTTDQSHAIPIETQFDNHIRYALINEHLLYIEKNDWEGYNTLSDRLETNPVYIEELSSRPSLATSLAFLAKKRNGPWEHPSQHTIKFQSLSQSLWTQPKKETELIANLKALLKEDPKDKEVKAWLVRLLFDRKNWSELQALTIDDLKLQALNYFVNKKLKVAKPGPVDACLQSIEIENFSASDLKNCSEASAQLVLQYKFSESLGLEKEVITKRVEQLNSQREIDLHVAKINRSLSGIWSLNPSTDPALQMFELLQ